MVFNYEPLLTKEDTETVVDYINSGIASPKYINLFENALSQFIGKSVITCNSGTSALHLSLLALGIGEGDEVICPAMSFAATWNVIRYVKENSYTDNASATAEGSAPSDTEFALVASDAIVQKIASVVTISQEMLDDTPALAGYLNTRLVGKLNTVVDKTRSLLSENSTVPSST